jgi:hypothetical protein
VLRFTAVVGIIIAVMGCTYDAAMRRLTPAEQAEFRAYSKVMTNGQAHTYLAKATPAERTAYVRQIGLEQRLQALDPVDRETVLGGLPRLGMSMEALLFLWGEPYQTKGRYDSGEWYYLGSSFSLAGHGNDYKTPGTWVVVHLTDGRVTGWLDFIPSINDDNGRDRERNR